MAALTKGVFLDSVVGGNFYNHSMSKTQNSVKLRNFPEKTRPSTMLRSNQRMQALRVIVGDAIGFPFNDKYLDQRGHFQLHTVCERNAHSTQN